MLDNQGCQTHLVAIMMTKSLFTLLESITFKNKTLGCTCKIFLENPRNISKTCGSKFLNLDLGAHYWTKQFQKTYVKITGRGKHGSVPSCLETFSYDLMLFNVQLHTLRKNLCYFKETLLKTVWKWTDSHEWQWCLDYLLIHSNTYYLLRARHCYKCYYSYYFRYWHFWRWSDEDR